MPRERLELSRPKAQALNLPRMPIPPPGRETELYQKRTASQLYCSVYQGLFCMPDIKEMPLFPLNTVLFPGMVLPLHIFEPRYKVMISECVRDNKPFGVILI